MFKHAKMDKHRFIVQEMRATPKKSDRRIVRTRHSLSQALVDLIKEKRFDEITIQDVIDRADVGRSTFYSHFRDKEDLFQEGWKAFLKEFASAIDWQRAGEGKFVPANYLFTHLRDVQPFYKGLVRSRMTDRVFKSGIMNLAEFLEEGLAAHLKNRPKPSLPVPVLVNYLATQLFALLKWWLDHDMPYPPERMDDMFHGLINPTFKTSLTPK